MRENCIKTDLKEDKRVDDEHISRQKKFGAKLCAVSFLPLAA